MIKLENVSKYYYSSTSITCALRKINLQLNIGEFVAITGESGSGKTTLLNVISGLDSYEDGEMYFNNKKTSYFNNDDWEQYRKNEIAFIFQNYNLIDSFTVLENVVVTYIIEGYSYAEANKKAKEILDLVGLSDDIMKKATKLSGGQKQRLSIARALAKETNIIVADEPTGNLDAENGKSILELLKRIAENKLVIVVTHNYAQIEPYITRKIRLRDGEIILDEKNDNNLIVSQISNSINNDNNQKFKTIRNFTFLNIKSQPKKTILLLLLILICTFSSFIFYANFKANIDDNKTKVLVQDFFQNFDDTRLLVKKNDSSAISENDLLEITQKHIIEIEKYDYITDMNYYRPDDYSIKVDGYFEEISGLQTGRFIEVTTYILDNHDKFMRSASSLSNNDLKYGRLPESLLEMVVYSDNPDIIGTKEKVLFKNNVKWGSDKFLEYDVEIVGVLNKNTNQAYFSDYLCKLMELTENSYVITFDYYTKGNTTKKLKFDTINIDPNLNKNQFSVDESRFTSIYTSCYLYYNNDVNKMLKDNGIYLSRDNNSFKPEFISSTINLNPNGYHNNYSDSIGVSIEFFDYFYDLYNNDTQFVVYIDDYSNTDEVINYLNNLGYDVISCFRASVSSYDVDKVVIRYANLLISIIALLVVNIIIIFISFSILKVKKNDYIIFKMLGLTNNLIKKINLFELLIYAIISNIILVITVNMIYFNTTNNLIIDILKNIKFYDYLLILLINLITITFLSKKFNKFITKNVKISVLREE